MAKTNKKTDSITVSVVEKVYKVHGKTLAAAVKETGLTQAEVAEQAGYRGASRICHLCRAESTEVAGKSLGPILTVLHNNGVTINGFDWVLAGLAE